VEWQGDVLAKQQDDGNWLVKCPLCGWRESLPTKVEAATNLNNHLNTTHQQGAQKRVKPKQSPRPAQDMPPQLSTPIKENK
jgi:hypothetical protein